MSLTPYQIQTIEEPLPYLGYPWVVAEQVYDPQTGIAISREFSVLSFESPTLQYLPGEPPNDTTEYGAYFSVQRKMVETKYLGQYIVTTDTTDPLSALNNYQGWLVHSVDWYIQNWYYDYISYIASWKPEYTTVAPIQPTGYYIFRVLDGNGDDVITPVRQLASVTSITLDLLPEILGVGYQSRTGTVNVYNVDNSTDVGNSTNIITFGVFSVLYKRKLKFTKPAATFNPGTPGVVIATLSNYSAAEMQLHGAPADGTIIFGDNVSEQSTVMHPLGTVGPTLYRPPGVTAVNEEFVTLDSTIGLPITERGGAWQAS